MQDSGPAPSLPHSQHTLLDPNSEAQDPHSHLLLPLSQVLYLVCQTFPLHHSPHQIFPVL